MSITSGGTRKAGPYSGNGITTSFPFSFKVFQASDLLVVQTDTTPTDTTLALTTNYTVTLNANQDSNPGGTVNLLVAPPSGYLLTIGSQVPQIQSVTLTNNGGFYPTVINTALDYLTILVQQLSEKIGRALTMPFSTNASGQLPPVSPGSLLGWKQDGSGIANVGASGVGAGSIVASNMAAGATGTALSTDTQTAPSKTTPADADLVPLLDSASVPAFGLKKLTWGNLKAVFKTYFSTLVGTQFQVSADLSPLWWGTQSTLTSGAAYALNGNILIMDAQCHNTQIDTNGNFTGVSETGIATCMLWGEDDVLRVFTAPSVTAGTVPTFGTTSTYMLDMKSGGSTLAVQQQSISASVAANSLTVGMSPVILMFRNATLTSGVPTPVAAQSALSLTIPSGATLGTVSGVACRLVLLAINNAGTMELAIVNQAGGVNLDETTLINTTAISAAATANNVIYSNTARTNVPFRVVGYIEAMEAMAGTWATAPSLVQGMGGQAGAAMQSLGMGQSLHDYSAGGRSVATTYYNTTGKPIWVSVMGTSSAGASSVAVSFNGGPLKTLSLGYNATGTPAAAAFIVPPGWSYLIANGTNQISTISTWLEIS